MKEVSNRVIAALVREIDSKGIPPERLTSGTPYSLDYLKDKNERIHWSEFAQIMRNARAIWTENELVDLGGAILSSPMIRAFAVCARMLFDTHDFYRWVNRGGGGNQLFTCVEATDRDLGVGRMLIELKLKEGYPVCAEFFLMTIGGLAVIPQLLGFRRAKVEMELFDRGARYTVDYPPGGGTLGWLRKAITWPFTARVVARELMAANDVLQVRYGELESARGALAQQATKLQTAHTISMLVHGNLDLGNTVDAIAGTLVEVGRFSGSMVTIASVNNGARVLDKSATAGQTHEPLPDFELVLPLRDGIEGRVMVWPAAGADLPERRALLEFVVPTLTMALDNALTFRQLLDYRQNLEHKVRERTSELVLARDKLSETVRSLETAQTARDRIFANINHEIRTPLTLVMLAVGAVRERLGDGVDRRVIRDLSTIEGSARKLLRLVDELLLLAARNENKLEIKARRCNLSALMHTVMATWTPAAEAAGLNLSAQIADEVVATVDEVAIERVVANLLSNAVKFTPRGGSIFLELKTEAGRASLTVRDSGLGLDPEFRRRIFGRFEQGHATVAHPTGSGIGLSLVKELVEAHAGRVEVESEPGHGSRFVVSLPLGAPTGLGTSVAAPRGAPLQPADFGVRTAEPPGVRVQEPSVTFHATILLAEDDPDLAAHVADLLGDEYRVVVAPDGLSALGLVETHRPDLLITDVQMPGMSGLELARRFREAASNRLAPVLMVSAHASDRARLAGFDAGAIDYITKPFNPDELRARVRSQLALRQLALRLHESEKLAAMGTLAAGMAHEMRNPANAILNAVEPLRELLPPELTRGEEPAAQLLDVLRDCAAHIATLSRQLLGFRRSGELELREITVAEVVSRSLSMTRPLLDQGDIELRDQIGYRGTVACAAPLLVQVLANLIENAAYAAGRGGWIQLASRADERRLIFEVSDSGAGVPRELRDRIFEPFFTTKPPGKGTGLGLTTSRDIIRRHRGVLDVRDCGDRSVFHLEIPLSPGGAE